ncbi:uncharacterized protein LOC124281370 [Haliotis rubra]|uniref:uncharacterized protein LOC124281370 n=1 Tax=Haliotis rubra TaxID=36100 RepID=UPI001EE5F69C|nr:uncharacterized protein LOC124281370 [Haliotis rubra]XP_046573363.1 uncharacterized protein LOC124281370 [Haliotis rubra]XP_046573364.1 uncharacterized protein LOC124281370 [Haliotis rubra]
MRSCVPILATLALSACYVYASPLVCVIFCSRGDEFPYVRTPDHCDCSSVKSGDLIRFDHIQERAVQNNHTHHSQTTPAPSTTTDICDYLCSIQLGGDACHCSIPGLPGRK